jgi:hypothetical protein
MPSQHIAPPVRDALHLEPGAGQRLDEGRDDRVLPRGAVGQAPHDGAAAARQLEPLARALQREREGVDAGKRRGIERLGGGDGELLTAYGSTRERARVSADFNRGNAAHFWRGNHSLTHEPHRHVNLSRGCGNDLR